MHSIKSRRSFGFGVSVFGIVMSVILFARPAHAYSLVSGYVSQVEYNGSNPSIPQLLVELNGSTSVVYFAQQPTPGCGLPALSADTVKTLTSLAQSALLSGKNIQLYYNTCGTTNFMYDIVLIR
jgi:hypothetical protein